MRILSARPLVALAGFFRRPRSGTWAGWVLGLTLAASASAEPWTKLLDKDLTGWDVYLSYRHRDGYNGAQPLDAEGQPVKPIGYGRNEAGVFTMVEQGGRPVLRVSGEIYGCLFTKQEYSNYRLRMKVKWGVKKWEPRREKLRDTGVLYHSVGESGVDYWRAWMLGQEFQIMEGHMGDYWPIANAAIDIRAFLPEGMMNGVADERQPFLPFGAKPSVDALCLRSVDRESPAGEWTDLELVCFEDKSLHIVNGHVVMVLRNSRAVKEGQATPLTRGKIQLQSEGAEVFFRDVEIQNITALPAKYARLFK